MLNFSRIHFIEFPTYMCVQYTVHLQFQTDSEIAVCDYVGFTCFYNSMRNGTRLRKECRHCQDDCQGVKFSHEVTVKDLVDEQTDRPM